MKAGHLNRSLAARCLRGVVTGLAILAPGLAAATTPSLVVDADTGRVLHQERATDPWYPASVTKLMTAYVALDMVRQGKVSLDQLLTISPEAAALPPSKMGFKPGLQLTLDNALKIIMVKSANDVAATIGENLGGSVEGFADLMNEASRRLGMRESRWFNQHGLPDDRQQTSARDMAILGRALLRDFPEYQGYFSLSAIQFGRRVMRNHNQLLGRYDGIDGMKTGFICSSGFNVVASASRGGRRIITVVFGSTKAKERTLKAADLFDRGFATGGFFGATGPAVEDLPASNVVAPPNMRPIICGGGGPVPGEEDSPVDGPVLAGAAVPAQGDSAAATAVSSTALAFAGASTAPGAGWRARELPPRAPLQPVLVWLGRDPAGAVPVDEAKPGSETSQVAGLPAAATPARKPKVARKVGAPVQAAAVAPAAKPEKPAVKAAPKPAPKSVAKPRKPAPEKAAATAKVAEKKAAKPKAKADE